jgi:hypothetical protein
VPKGPEEQYRGQRPRYLRGESLIDATATGSSRSPFQPVTAEGWFYTRNYGV